MPIPFLKWLEVSCIVIHKHLSNFEALLVELDGHNFFLFGHIDLQRTHLAHISSFYIHLAL